MRPVCRCFSDLFSREVTPNVDKSVTDEGAYVDNSLPSPMG